MISVITCTLCPHHCRLKPGQTGFCRARSNEKGHLVPSGYGFLSAMALDPIEKKPLKHFKPGSPILSIGFYGCSMRCPFCQNAGISQRAPKKKDRRFSPREVLAEANALKETSGNIGVAYTYSEPLVHYEFVRDTAGLIRNAGMVNVLVTNGQCSDAVLDELLPLIDAVNVDLKGFRPDIYQKLGGDFETTRHFIRRAAAACHVEVTTLVVPGLNDGPEDMAEESRWLAEIDPDIVLHLTRYFPMYQMTAPPTDLDILNQLKTVAEDHLHRVYLGNV
ncbi:MAG: radical SAM protein [Pseudoramibacter sp.]